MDYLRELMKDYKDEIQDIFASDRQLAQELEYEYRLVNASARERQALLQQQQQQQRELQQHQQANFAASADVPAPSPVPKLKTGLPAAYNPSPAKVRKTSASLEASSSPEEEPAPSNKRMSVLTSPTLARMRAANINFMSPTKKSMQPAAATDDTDALVAPARLDLFAAVGDLKGAKKPRAKKAAGKKASTASAAPSAMTKKAAAPKRKRKVAGDSDAEDADAEEVHMSDVSDDELGSRGPSSSKTDENTAPMAPATKAVVRQPRATTKRTKRD